MSMRTFNVTGMSCAACSARVERAVRGVEGVTECSVNLLTATMTAEGASDEAIIKAVVDAGYGAALREKKTSGEKDDDLFHKRQRRVILLRLILSLLFLAPLMYVTMGYLMWGAPMPEYFSAHPLSVALLELALATPVLIINKKFFINGVRGVIKGAPNMDTLVALGSGVSFLWSAYILICMIGSEGNLQHYLHELYFESAAMILTLITVGKLLESVAKGRTADAVRGLMDLTPKTATVIRGGVELVIPTSEVLVGELFVVKAGASIPVDGIVREGAGAVDESALTGESMPNEKTVGAAVLAATVNTSGYMVCEATRVGEDTAMAGVIKMVEDATATKAPIARVADRVAGIFVPAVLLIAVITTAIWLFVSGDIGFALSHGIAVLVISCPCALGLATPVAIMVGSGVGAGQGVLFKNATALETLGRVRTVLLDKTGTLTRGVPEVASIYTFGIKEDELLSLAASVEGMSEHPIGGAVVRRAESAGADTYTVTDFEVMVGRGVRGIVDGREFFGVSYACAKELIELPREAEEIWLREADLGRTPVFFICDGVLVGIISVADQIKPDARESISELKSMGLEVVMLTGDNERAAVAVADALGGCKVVADVLPGGKETVVKEYLPGGVAMVGDGINDSPALVRADVGIAIGTGTDIAIESADVVLMREGLSGLVGAIRLSRATLGIIKENLFWAFIYNVIGIPLAAGAFSALLGWHLSPMFGAAAMSLSSVTVVLNALRLNLKRTFAKRVEAENGENEKIIYEGAREVPAKGENMEKTFKVEGMMCPHCEAHVVKALTAIDGVAEAVASHKACEVKVTLTSDVSSADIVAAIEGAGYKVV